MLLSLSLLHVRTFVDTVVLIVRKSCNCVIMIVQPTNITYAAKLIVMVMRTVPEELLALIYRNRRNVLCQLSMLVHIRKRIWHVKDQPNQS